MKKQAFTKSRIVVLALVAMVVVGVTTYVVAVTNIGEGAIRKFDGGWIRAERRRQKAVVSDSVSLSVSLSQRYAAGNEN